MLSHLLILCALLAPTAAPPVDFSGTWVFDAARTAALAAKDGPAGKGTAGTGQAAALPEGDIVIRQTSAAFTTERRAFGDTIRYTFDLSGAASTNHSGAVTLVTHSRWEGATLVTEGLMSQVTSQGYDEWRVKEVRSLDRQGSMIVETTNVATGGAVTSSRRVYVRKAR